MSFMDEYGGKALQAAAPEVKPIVEEVVKTTPTRKFKVGEELNVLTEKDNGFAMFKLKIIDTAEFPQGEGFTRLFLVEDRNLIAVAVPPEDVFGEEDDREIIVRVASSHDAELVSIDQYYYGKGGMPKSWYVDKLWKKIRRGKKSYEKKRRE